MKELLENFYGYHSFCGELFLYGDNIPMCKSHIDNLKVESIEEVCEYCSQHNIRIYFNPNHSLRGFFGIFTTYFLTKKYGVHSTWKDVLQYLEKQK